LYGCVSYGRIMKGKEIPFVIIGAAMNAKKKKGREHGMDSNDLMKNRFRELANRCYRENRYTFTDFLGLGELADWFEVEQELRHVPYTMEGGSEGAERVLLRFGSEEMLGYEEAFPIAVLEVAPLQAKFADDLSHRDVLGALMSLGIERSVLGDIFVSKTKTYIVCLSTMVEYICRELTQIRHTSVSVKEIAELPKVAVGEPEEVNVSVSSERIDGVISKVFDLSRSDTVELFRRKLVFRNGRLEENNSRMLAVGDKVTIRGFGRFTVGEFGGVSRKGKQYISIYLYGKRKK